VPRSLVRESIPPRRYASHVALVSSISERSSCLEEERCDASMEKCDVWQIVVDLVTAAGVDLQVVGLVEL